MTNESKKTPVSFNPSADRLRTPTGPVSAAGHMGVPAADTGHNPQDLDSLRKIAEAHGVRPGPWHVYDRGIGYEVHDDSGYELTGGMRETFDKPDAEFIATFDPLQVLALITRTEQAEQAVARVRDVIRQYDMACLTCQCSSDGDCCKCTVADFQKALGGDGRG